MALSLDTPKLTAWTVDEGVFQECIPAIMWRLRNRPQFAKVLDILNFTNCRNLLPHAPLVFDSNTFFFLNPKAHCLNCSVCICKNVKCFFVNFVPLSRLPMAIKKMLLLQAGYFCLWRCYLFKFYVMLFFFFFLNPFSHDWLVHLLCICTRY